MAVVATSDACPCMLLSACLPTAVAHLHPLLEQTSWGACCWRAMWRTAWRGHWRTAPRAALHCTWRLRRAGKWCATALDNTAWPARTGCRCIALAYAAVPTFRAPRCTRPPAPPQVMDLLLESGADPHRLDFSARNALDLAVLHGHLDMVPALLEAGSWFTSGAGDDEAQPAQPGPGEPGAAQLELLRCLAAEEPLEHPAFAGIKDGTELVADSFRLSFAECAARGKSARLQQDVGFGRWREMLGVGSWRKMLLANACQQLYVRANCLLLPCSEPAGGAAGTRGPGAGSAWAHRLRGAGGGSAQWRRSARCLAATGSRPLQRGCGAGAGGSAAVAVVWQGVRCTCAVFELSSSWLDVASFAS